MDKKEKEFSVDVEKVMDRPKIAKTLHTILDVGIDLLNKKKLDTTDFQKVKIIRTLGSHINAAISMVQQETAQSRLAVVVERMRQLGYEGPKQIGS